MDGKRITRIEQQGKEFNGDPRFYDLLNQMAELHSKKNHDYAGEDPLSNFRISEKIGIPAWKGALIRLSDKISRIWTFAKKERLEVSDETFMDTLMDLAVYALIIILLYEDTRKIDSSNISEDSICADKFIERDDICADKFKEIV
jgi:hypothetical protein